MYEQTSVDRLAPVLGHARARDIASVACAINQMIGASPVGQLEDHMLLPALAAVLGTALGHSRRLKEEHAADIAAGSTTVWPSLLDPDEVVSIFYLTNVMPDRTTQAEALELLRARLQQRLDDRAFAELDAEVKG